MTEWEMQRGFCCYKWSFGKERKNLFTTKDLARRSRNRNPDYLPQRRKGRKGRKNNGEKFTKIIHLFPPNLACFAPWRESIPRVRVFQITGKFAQAAQTSSL
jgi:hypothetical protein